MTDNQILGKMFDNGHDYRILQGEYRTTVSRLARVGKLSDYKVVVCTRGGKPVRVDFPRCTARRALKRANAMLLHQISADHA